ncbi:MAG: helix-hairpin-helix domain-containing protein, partial [Phaeodactylibacter sp.]|nr:helix-hairpin-helix domain-containing protein [Phaeodactylibacter sp.]
KAGYKEFLQLGFSERVAKTLLAFRKKGGQFYQPQDLLKVYGLEPALLEQVQDRLYFPEKQTVAIPEGNPKPYSERRAPILVDINQSTATDWQALHGIGPAYANRIINFRDKLGGFASVDQIAETWGLPDSTFQQIKPFLQFSPVFQQVSINTATIETLSRHPYINKKTAQLIVRFRENHGPYSSLEALLQIPLIQQDLLDRLAPYLSL